MDGLDHICQKFETSLHSKAIEPPLLHHRFVIRASHTEGLHLKLKIVGIELREFPDAVHDRHVDAGASQFEKRTQDVAIAATHGQLCPIFVRPVSRPHAVPRENVDPFVNGNRARMDNVKSLAESRGILRAGSDESGNYINGYTL